METKNIVVVGGGAAGFFCAIQIAEMHPNWQGTIVEKSSKLLLFYSLIYINENHGSYK